MGDDSTLCIESRGLPIVPGISVAAVLTQKVILLGVVLHSAPGDEAAARATFSPAPIGSKCTPAFPWGDGGLTAPEDGEAESPFLPCGLGCDIRMRAFGGWCVGSRPHR